MFGKSASAGCSRRGQASGEDEKRQAKVLEYSHKSAKSGEKGWGGGGGEWT